EIIPYDERTCIIVVEWEDDSVGMIIDRVCEVLDVAVLEMTPPPDYRSVNSNRFIKHLINRADGVKLVLDCGKLIND
ncbi:MAG: chemotaxis protein CheW, partial [Oscillospiraceae bacterium]